MRSVKTMGSRQEIRCLLFFLMVALLLAPSPDALAANGSETIANAGTGLGGDFDEGLKTLATGTVKIMHGVMIVMTALAGMMIVFGLEDGKKFIWQIALGAGLAFNFGAFLMDAGFWSMAQEPGTVQQVTAFTPELVTGDGANVKNLSILGSFVAHFKDNVITPGAANITPYCLRLLVILTVIQASWELSMKLISGNKMQYLISMTLKLGFFSFLMMNWIPFMKALMEGFQMLGVKAAGQDLQAGQELITKAADGIVQTVFNISALILFPKSPDSLTGMALSALVGNVTNGPRMILCVVIVCVLVFCFFLVAIEIAMAYIEFYVMALLTIPCLAFGTMGKFSFLTEKAIGAMFNCALKVCVIGFLALFTQTYLEGLGTQMETAQKAGEISQNLALMLQTVLASFLIYMLIKKIPKLVSSLLNGAPQLSGSDMMGSMRSAANAPVNAAATVTGNYGKIQAARAAAQAAGRGGVRGSLTQLARNSVMSSKPVRSYREGISNFRNTKDRTGSYDLNQIRNGVKVQDDNKRGGGNNQDGKIPR